MSGKSAEGFGENPLIPERYTQRRRCLCPLALCSRVMIPRIPVVTLNRWLRKKLRESQGSGPGQAVSLLGPPCLWTSGSDRGNPFSYHWSYCKLSFLLMAVQSISTNTSRWRIIPLLCREKLGFRKPKRYMRQLVLSDPESEFLTTSFQACLPFQAYTMLYWISDPANEAHQNCHQSPVTVPCKYCIRCTLVITTVYRGLGLQNHFTELQDISLS